MPGLLEIPAIGLTAPVLNGLGESVLGVAVGHDPATVWPGGTGESLLLAHDVSYFSGLGQLRPGDSVIWEIGCERTTFRVTGAQITVPGAAVPAPTSGSGLALITCWPTNALFWTSDRYIVETTLVSRQQLRHPVGSTRPTPSAPLVPAPRSLTAEGLALGQSGVIAGQLRVSGSPPPAIRFGPEPLAIANAAFSDLAAAEKTAAAGNRSWWSAIALAGVPLPRPWSLRYSTDVTVEFERDAVRAVVLTSQAITVTLVVRQGKFFVASVRS